MDMEWMAKGNCRNEPPGTFFPSDGVGVEIARRICATCPVKGACLEYAIATRQPDGVWGGLTGVERHRLIRRRQKLAREEARETSAA